ncbi:MAG TPA: hypothetical protein VMC85_07815, partial [Desulfomonilaceae bacterium]|nr:hypothetical protein [Desulfomonilaceae bacterium]
MRKITSVTAMIALMVVLAAFCPAAFADRENTVIEGDGKNERKPLKELAQKESEKVRYPIMSGKVDVIAVTDTRPPVSDDQRRKCRESGEEWRCYIHPHFDLMVKTRQESFVLSTWPCGGIRSLEEAVSRIKEGTRWKYGHLFVPTECGCGNFVHCNRLEVFTIRRGRLIHIGSNAELPDEDCFFYDIKQIGDIGISFASSALFPVLMREEAGRFVVDLDRTWEKNKGLYEKEGESIERLKNQSAEKHFETLLRPFLFRAALAAYCNRMEELRRVLQEAALTLDEKQFEIIDDIA